MPITPIFSGMIANGRLHLNERGKFDNYLLSLNNRDIECIVRKKRKPKTQNQLGYFYGVVCKIISDHTGSTPKEVKKDLKEEILSPISELTIGGVREKIYPSLKNMDTETMSMFIDESIRIAAQHHRLVIPEPHEVEY